MTEKLPAEPRWDQLRRQMPVATQWAYMDHAAVAPLPTPARDAVVRWSDESAQLGDMACPQWGNQVEQIRQLTATLLGAEADDVAFVQNTTAGITLVAEGFPWQRGDNVVTLANEFPSNQYPWMNLAATRGVETRRVEVPDARPESQCILRHCDERTRVISISWVGFSSGWRIDIDALVEQAHERGILVFLDAIQGLGVFPLDVGRTPVDFLAADGHKWMLGPEGAGVFYVRREHLDRLHPLGVGWNSVRHASDFDNIALELRPTARRYEGGSANTVGVLALGASLQLLSEMGLSAEHSAVAERVLQVTDSACGQLQQAGARVLSARGGPCRSGIVSFELPGQDSNAVRQACLREGVVLSCRGGSLRISPHAYTNQEDIERLVRGVTRFGT
ncbi:MAG: aminotransferase class V-fold PLP-dependent enzyme [Planctomycetota bacterium]